MKSVRWFVIIALSFAAAGCQVAQELIRLEELRRPEVRGKRENFTRPPKIRIYVEPPTPVDWLRA